MLVIVVSYVFLMIMGSMIHLAVGRLEVDWGKNHGFSDHSALFQTTDVTQVPYYYGVNDSETGYKTEDGWYIETEFKEGLSKPLKEVVERINLLGHTLKYCEKEFKYLSQLNQFDIKRFRFRQLKEAMATVDVQSLSLDYGEGGEDFGKFFRREIFKRIGLEKIVDDARYVQYHAGEGMENLSPYTILQLLAANPSAAGLPVTWAFDDVARNGWAKRSEFVRPLDPSNKFLIVTEGSSDGLILKHAFSLLKPHLSDFFYFIDMQEGYPFSGTGNLVNFVKGLISIAVQNNIMVLFDNDAEGVASLRRCMEFNIPSNMTILKLPDLREFKKFKTVGPLGHYLADINGKGAAIECYLDLEKDAEVRWNNFNKSVNAYQGELMAKDSYKRTFLDQKERHDTYDYRKIEAVLDMIIKTAMKIKEQKLVEVLENEL